MTGEDRLLIALRALGVPADAPGGFGVARRAAQRLSAQLLDRQFGAGDRKNIWFLLHEPWRAMANSNRTRLGGIVGIDGTFVGGCRRGQEGARQQKGRKVAMVFVAVDARPRTYVAKRTGQKVERGRSARAREALIVRSLRADV